MLKIFLVEDERIMREGIKENIDWEKEGFIFTGEAQDGELAYPLIQKSQPDILITDIKMPFMDGLELSKLVRKEMPSIKIIILSGFDEFEFAKEALNIGVTEYLLKPIDREELVEALKKVAGLIYDERSKEESMNKLHEETLLNQALLKKNFLNKTLLGQLSAVEILDEGKKLGIDFTGQYYQVILLELEESDVEELKKICMENEYRIYMDRDMDEYCVILKSFDSNELKVQRNLFIQRMKQWLEALNKHYFIGIGNQVSRLSQLHESFGSAKRVFAYHYLMPDNNVMTSLDNQVTGMNPMERIDIEQLNPDGFNHTSIEKFLKLGSMDKVGEFLNQYFDSVGVRNLNSFIFRQYISMNIYILVVTFLDTLGYEQKKIEEVCEDISNVQIKAKQVDVMKAYMNCLITNALYLRDEIPKQKYAPLIEKAKAFIHETYNDDRISLQSVAEHVNMSPSHFSVIFSKETEKTFTDYLTEIRMDKAKELLRCTSMKTSEICFEVGYKNPQYFSYLFKKINHYTPSQYKQQGRGAQ